ncbi:IS66-like element accessory protein TnpA [Vibrio sp.]|uniref:IS66-like element accessory protein TnpA n=1 Tax=Vibrio sp. TaxID=678 RepID=UPI003D0D7814
MNEILPVKPVTKRRRHSKDFKARILEACEQPGASVAGVALANGLNANLVHKWRRLAKVSSSSLSAPTDFIPVPMATSGNMPTDCAHVVLEVDHIKIQWPLVHIDRAIAWLRLLRA